MKLLREYLIEIDSEYQDTIWGPEKKVKFFLAGHHVQRTDQGIVRGTPLAHYGPEQPQSETKDFDPGVCVATQKGRFWWEASVNDKLEEGDRVWFAMNANNADNHLGNNQLRIRPYAIMAYQKQDQGPVIPYGGKVFIRREENVQGVIYQQALDKLSSCKGEIVATGIPLNGQIFNIRVGDKIMYEDAYNHVIDLPELGFVAVVPHTKIIYRHDI